MSPSKPQVSSATIPPLVIQPPHSGSCYLPSLWLYLSHTVNMTGHSKSKLLKVVSSGERLICLLRKATKPGMGSPDLDTLPSESRWILWERLRSNGTGLGKEAWEGPAASSSLLPQFPSISLPADAVIACFDSVGARGKCFKEVGGTWLSPLLWENHSVFTRRVLT